MSDFFLLFYLSWNENMMIFFIFENFSKNQKNWSFRPPWTCGIFCLNSHMCTFFIQLSEFLCFSCPGVKIWWFSSFLKTLHKIENIEVFDQCGPGDLFGSIHIWAHFSSKWVNFYNLVLLEWKYDDFLHFRKFSKKAKKLKFSPTADRGTFLAKFTNAHFSSKWVNFYILGVLEWIWWFPSF